MNITIKPIHAATLNLDGHTITVERLGKGRYSTAWLHRSTNGGSDTVYVQTKECDASKEILCGLTSVAFMPSIEVIGSVSGYNWYKMPLYQPLTAKHKTAWSDFKVLASMFEEARRAVVVRNRRFNYEVESETLHDQFLELLDASILAPKYRETFERLTDACSNYGTYMLEFGKRNTMVDAKGELVFLDPVFDYAEVRASQEKRAKAPRGW